jgi:hypothetical protein
MLCEMSMYLVGLCLARSTASGIVNFQALLQIAYTHVITQVLDSGCLRQSALEQ